jgi:hypothetical protein
VLDNLGNWSGDENGAGGYASVVTAEDLDGNGEADSTPTLHHNVNAANEVVSTVVDLDGSGTTVTTTPFTYDAAGNLVSDGTFMYQYDAFNRLIQIRDLGTITFLDDGQLEYGYLGNWTRVYVHDGLGRLTEKWVRKSPSETTTRHEQHFYDGVRRIQEVVSVTTNDSGGTCVPRPNQPCGGWKKIIPTRHGTGEEVPDSGTHDEVPGATDGLSTSGIDGASEDAASPLKARLSDVEPLRGTRSDDGDDSGDGLFDEKPAFEDSGDLPHTLGTLTWMEREYVYHPNGDVNELILQVDEENDPFYVLQDGNLNVTALLDAAGAILRQYSFNTYGELSAYEWFTDASGDPLDAPDNAVGFQGLFFDRIAEPGTIPAFELGAKGVYLTPNRTYDPELGRWLQRDPNATAQPVLASMATHGDWLTAPGSMAFGLDGVYGDGFSLYQFALSNPITGSDPLGLSSHDFDWFAEAEQIEEEILGQRLYALGEINEKAKWASIGLQASLDLASAILGVDIIETIGEVADGRGGFWDSMDIVLAMTPVGKVRKITSIMAKANRLRRIGKGASRFSELFLKWLNGGPKNVSVYIARKDGKVVGTYVGISNDVVRRKRQHGKRFDDLIPLSGATGLTRNQARSVEQLVIEANSLQNINLQNINNSISPSSPFFLEAIDWAEDFVPKNNVKIRH